MAAAIEVNTLFELCNDVEAMKAFYSDTLALDETFYNAERGWLTYQVGAVQIVFTRPTSPLPVPSEWSRSPAWDGGSRDAPSWVFRVEPAEFDGLVDRLRRAVGRVETRTVDDGAVREVFTLDPMGKTVEIFCEAEPRGDG